MEGLKLIIAVDLGNYNIKTCEGIIFESRYQEVEKEDFDTDLLELENKFYRMESGDFENEFNKAKKNFIPNLLYAISKSCDVDNIETDLVLGVPASNLGISEELKEKLLNKSFNFNLFEVTKNIKINKVATVAEGLSSFYTLPKEERTKDLVILDIGGRTWNICVSSGGKCIMKFTVPGGMIDLYSEIQEDYNKLGNNADVEEIIRLIKNDTIDASKAKERFVKDKLNKVRLKVPNFSTYKIWGAGGGSLDLQDALRENLGNINFVPDPLFSNVKGNKLIAEAKWGK